MRRGLLLVISGFAGSGKGTIVKELLSRYENYALSVSATTRDPRPGERDGIEYFFITEERFEEMIAANELLEHARYVSHYYGTPKSFVEKQLDAGKDVILEIECQGALQIKKIFPEALLIFVMPPSVQEVYNRLHKRGTETEDVIMSRIRRGREESEVMDRYDFLLINDDLDECVSTLHDIVNSSRHSVSRSQDLINDIHNQFDTFLEGE